MKIVLAILATFVFLFLMLSSIFAENVMIVTDMMASWNVGESATRPTGPIYQK